MKTWREIACGQCGEPFQITDDLYQFLKRSSNSWHCPHGHVRYYPQGKTEAEKLREQLDAERRARQRAEQNAAYEADTARRERNRANGYKGHATRMTKRAKAGVCPCCNRTFKQLASHMANKHPGFTPIEIAEGVSLQ